MAKDIKKIMIALTGRNDESVVIEQAVFFADKFDALLVAIHINDPHAGRMSMMMDSPGPKISEDDIKNLFKRHGYENSLENLEVRIIENEHISKTIAENAVDIDLLVLGHRRMSTFKANFMDSIDEGIANLSPCPVVVVQS